ncbi:MAG TPA: acyl-CoA dehydrogenase family protein [Rhizomicrobium sp.]|nr:acyl-CoA dehydrogenase family protein [Rhizomicrobium sp.]
MGPLRPNTHLETHDVVNQPPPFEDVNFFTSDRALQGAVAAQGGASHFERLEAFGARVGASEVQEWAAQANRYPPQLRSFDRYGARLDEVEFHPAYHRLMALGLEAGIASAPWTGIAAGHVLHAGLEFLMAQAEPGVCCPITMTYGAGAVLKHQREIPLVWAQKIATSRYDPSSRPANDKSGVTLGMAMTEKQGGSDVRANTTRAVKSGGGSYLLHGHKWFCSAPMSDAFFTLAYTDQGLSCFLVPRWTGKGERNGIQIMRLKDKLGDRANASAEIEYHDAKAELVGEDGRGIPTIIEMVHHTRLDCLLAPAAYIRQAVANALWHTNHRYAFQRKLIDQPLMRQVLADMVIESEAATALTFRIARSFDESAGDAAQFHFARIATPIGKYWINKRAVNLVYEAMEVHGGAGYIEESVMPRLYRQSPLNSIWEGSGNIICLDVLRALMRAPDSRNAFVAELEQGLGHLPSLDRAVELVKIAVSKPQEEAGARRLVETMALALEGVVLVQNAPPFVAEAYCGTRLDDRPGFGYGALPEIVAADALIARAMPAV